MKRLAALLFLITALSFRVVLSPLSSHSADNSPTHAATTTQPVIPPQTLVIDKLGIRAPVEQVGKDAQGRMDIPGQKNEVAWYRLGAAPGEIGNAVIDGHVDWYTGPAIFYNLSDLTVGDKIGLIRQDGRQLNFTVTKVGIYEDSRFPLQEVFGPANTANLNLITCTGIFDHASKIYSHRLVIYSQLTNP